MRSGMTRRQLLAAGSLCASSLALRGTRLFSQATKQVDASIDIMPGEPIGTIAPEIYSHFIEQLGGVIYDGVWVGKGSSIKNENGVRKTFLDAMRAIKAPVMRWPGGCFADSYDWRDGLGGSRPQRTAFWTQEDSNHFGTHEFMGACKAIGCEPYLAANVRSMPAKDFYQWVEYCNAPAGTGNDLAQLREKNGSRDPFRVKFWGVGNESWGCGGDMTPEEYGHTYRQYAAWLPKYPDQPMHLVGVGPNGYDLEWTRRVFESFNGHLPWGLSTHYYTSGSAKKFAAGDALQFTESEHIDLLARANGMEQLLQDHWLQMQGHDSTHKTKFVVDEWGAWYGDSSRIGPKYNLSQVPTLRDALLTGITLDIFQRNADKVAMACVAQTINCLHSLMLAREDKFITTPVYNVFQMYMPHMGAQALRSIFDAPAIANPLAQDTPVGGNSATGTLPAQKSVPGLSGSASRSGSTVTLSVVNANLHDALSTQVRLRGSAIRGVTGQALFETDVHAHNDFTNPSAVKTRQVTVTDAMLTGGALTYTFPPASVTTLSLTLS